MRLRMPPRSRRSRSRARPSPAPTAKELGAKEAAPAAGLDSAKEERRFLFSSFFTALAAICSAQESVLPKVRSETGEGVAPPPSEPSSDLPMFGLLILRPRLGENEH